MLGSNSAADKGTTYPSKKNKLMDNPSHKRLAERITASAKDNVGKDQTKTNSTQRAGEPIDDAERLLCQLAKLNWPDKSKILSCVR
ncbi:hypothetical protein PTTG_25586 [Puccinia triticina 1-1 BBBD Race 1]|uniref:Uncharacterized protein n=1 Tax=Puccinia triticina (isolate 1-1 / race 1 (BBBD)) TaxID=630390 RepID=A0A180H0F0_PUCT1|nr:hypothetical protein PTTG_25586 [Puccinia triticina 1-1 BBBD Race 1]